MNEEIINAYEVIKEGGIILYPTDTVWGIGCDATNPDAVAKIYKLKQRAGNTKHDRFNEWRKDDLQCFQKHS